MRNILSFEEFKQAIFRITEEHQNHSELYFLSGDISLEKNYSTIAVYRWYEVYTYLCSQHLSVDYRILDVGVTPFTFFLKKHGFANIEALDLSDAFKTRCNLYEIPFYSGGLFSENSKSMQSRYDCVLFLEVIEHIHRNPIEVIDHLYSLLKDQGQLYLTTPNLMVLSNRYKMLFNKKLDQLHYPPFQHFTSNHGPEHDRIYMPAELVDYCKASSFKKFKLSYSIALEKYRYQQRTFLQKLVQSIAFLIKKTFPSTSSTIILILTK